MPDFSPVQLAIALVIALVVLGPKRLPEVGRSLGRGIREFKGSLSGEADEPRPDERPAGALEAKLPEAGRSLGTGIRHFKDGLVDAKDEFSEGVREPAREDSAGAGGREA